MAKVKTVYVIGKMDSQQFKQFKRWFDVDGKMFVEAGDIFLFTTLSHELITYLDGFLDYKARLFQHGFVIGPPDCLWHGKEAKIEVARTLDRVVEILTGHSLFYQEVAFTSQEYYLLRERGRRAMFYTELLEPMEVAA